MTEKDALALIREAHAPVPYEFPTDQTYCPSSDVPSDQCHTCIVLVALDARVTPAHLAAILADAETVEAVACGIAAPQLPSPAAVQFARAAIAVIDARLGLA